MLVKVEKEREREGVMLVYLQSNSGEVVCVNEVGRGSNIII